ncbi:MAG: O-methyltransferase [Mariniphaga sp.]|nr:O-methyltransferase [Mariniphaga sp.]
MENNPEIENYILQNIDNEDPVLQELTRETNLKAVHPRMISGHIQGLILTMLSKMIRPQNILEVGTFTGYSAICLAKGLVEGGHIYTIEVEDELEHFASRYFEKAGIKNSVVQLIGDAKILIPEIKESFDLVFLDADKKDYCSYYKLVFDKVPSGGYIIADNTLWDGKVIQPIDPNDYFTQGIKQFNELIRNDSRVEKVILPIRDGITIIRKK